ncbi:MAG TPA: C25 family cysteine peptidase, partial [Bacteroidota bacterium]|nr:C25 family cysteine peptidase [Bacteroidota bacterium]
MRRVTRRFILAAFTPAFLSLLYAGAGGPSKGSSFALKAEADGWTIKYLPKHIPSRALAINGVQHTQFTSASPAALADSGSPQLPVETVSLGIPFGARITVELVDPVYRESTNQLVAPAPRYRRTAEGEHTAIYQKNDAAYALDKFYPARSVWFDPPFVFRDQRIVTVHLSPVLYNPARKVLRYLTGGAIRIRTGYGARGKPAVNPTANKGSSARLEPLYKSLMLNYDQAREWRAVAAKPAAIRSDSTRDWFIPGRPYYVIPVVADGWYRLTKTDLAAAGVSAGQLDTSTVALWYRGRRVPLMVRPDSTLEFYALRNHGDSTFYDWYTDTSSYWLTWGSTPGSRYSPSAASGAPVTSTVLSALTTLHLEQNTALYQGTTEEELTTSGPIPGKGWVWEYYYPGTQFTHPFTIDSLDLSVASASIRVRLFSTTPHYQSPDHIAQFWMNDSLLGSVAFDGRTEGYFSSTFPARWLAQGTNQLRILSNPPNTSNINQFYLDWFEIDYQRPLHTSSNQLVFMGPASSGGGSASFTVSGFQNPSIDVFDLTDGRMITGGVVSGSAGAGYAVAFRDSFALARQYAVLCQGGPLPVLPVSQRVISDIRSNQAGADYIIITHRAFMTAARQLAAFRQASNGLRVSVVDVQDIYDQFNYGMLNVNPIKAFLQYACTSWPSPAPSYLMMFGDASWDFHRYLSTTVKTNYVPAYGVPGGDNWYACFDTANTFIPSMLIGRLPVQDTVQAASTVAKIAGYESAVPAQWTKSFLFISGGTTPSEQLAFNGMSDYTINTYVAAPPIGGYAYTVYKSTPDAIDGEHKQQLQDIVKSGVVFLNFLGHSGGRIWGVDIGSPDDLQNTSGDLPFVSSVSCNVGAFSEPSSNVLSEDFVLADNRGAVAFWASASLAYADIGSDLVNNFFQGVTVDSVRDFGALTTAARIELWQTSGTNYITIGSVNLTPLLGDPLSHFALPLKPDLAVGPSDLYLNSKIPTPGDSVLALTAIVHNYGLVPSDSVTILLTDIYNGVVTPLLNNVRIAPPRLQDSLVVPWRGTKQIGQHTLVLNVDPLGVIAEVTKANNIVSVQEYVYANLLYVVRPLENMLVPPGPQLLRVTSPIGVDSATMQIAFQLDTSSTFASPFLLSSPAINPGPVSA